MFRYIILIYNNYHHHNHPRHLKDVQIPGSYAKVHVYDKCGLFYTSENLPLIRVEHYVCATYLPIVNIIIPSRTYLVLT